MFSPELVNGPFGDPGLFVDFRFEPRAILLDLGDVSALPAKKILRISDVFVSHTHMDHFCGFDRLLRVCLGRDTALRMFGPPGFVAQVAHKLAAYTWNLVERYPGDFVIDAWELDAASAPERERPLWHAHGRRFRCRERFRPEPLDPRTLAGGVLIDDPTFRVRVAVLDHGTPCLAFALDEKCHVNVWKNRLADLGLPVGPWVKALKDAVIAGQPDDTPVRAWWRDRDGHHERVFPLGALRDDVVRVVPGETIAYVTDVGFNDVNRRRIIDLAAGATRLFIECPFLDQDADQAAARSHLTARQAGQLARESRAQFVIPFHFSPRYEGRDTELRAEVDAAHQGT